ncbi:hypothetical protein [Mesonia aestuariivivens]|uniref:Uncharacterized protein n=1 Tax=Mesonia aestuariivivens TaxID=2796128 RepID=A0ABS6VZD4_9FLAO|nr:hypothetical protein [Mesonia aestuariivivens]MBW2960662.1 hypothetical protein [Mesonia aestuariivivens]
MIILVITGVIGSLVTYLLNNHFKLGAVLSSAFPSLIIGLFFYFFSETVNNYLQQQIPIVFIGASFVGMVSKQILHHYLYVILAGIVFAIVYLNKGTFFNNFGGALGTTACIGVITAMSLSTIIKHKGIKRKKSIK